MKALAETRLPNGGLARVLLGDQINDELLTELDRLLQDSFEDGWPGFAIPRTSADHLRWKLEGPNASAPSYVTLVEVEGRVVSMAVALREQVLVRGERLTFEGGADACTHPDYGGRGMFSQRREFEAGNIELWLDGSLSNSGNPVVLRRRERRGELMPPWVTPRVLVRVYNPLGLAGLQRRAGGRIPVPVLAVGLTPIWALASIRRRRRAPGGGWELTPIEQFDDRFDDLFADAAQSFDFIKVRDVEYLNWRYADPRAGNYRTIAATEADQLLGFVTIKHASRRGHVMDLLVRPGRVDVAEALVGAADDAFRQVQVFAAMCWLPPTHPYRSALARYGFFDSRQPSGVSLKTYAGPHARSLDFLADPGAGVHIMLGDSDRA